VIDAIAKRMMREACILEALRHAGFPCIYECGVLDDRRLWIAFELLDGPTLADAIADRPLSPAETLALLRDLSEILHHAHLRGVVHCRLRPELIVRETSGLVITSWGDAHTHDAPARPHLEPADIQIYLAPELIGDDTNFDERADIFSLGVIAYEALTLAAPTIPLLRRLPALPRSIALLIERMTSETPLARPTASEVRAEAVRLLEIETAPEPVVDEVDGVVEEIELELTQDLAAEQAPAARDEAPHVMRARWTPHENIYSPPQPPPGPTTTPRRKPS
jgi:serine/threonine protein kinase